MIVIHILGLWGYISIGCMMIVLARLSQRLGAVTHARPYYLALYVAAMLMGLTVIVRLYFITQGLPSLGAINPDLLYTLLSDGLPAVSVTIGLLVAWYYWSWLLAERD